MRKKLETFEEMLFAKVDENDPSQAFLPDKGIACITVTSPTQIQVVDEDGEVVSSKVALKRYLLISKLEETGGDAVTLQPYDAKTLMSLGLIAKPESYLIPPKYSPEFLKNVRDGKIEAPSPVEVFNQLLSLLSTYIEFQDDKDMEFVALWIIGTYFYRLFESYPYLYVNGLKRTGKTKLLRFLEMTAFNGLLSSNLTSSSLFRLVSDWGACLLMDEEEGLTDPSRKLDFRSLLLSGYKRGGLVFRSEGEGRKVPTAFDVYSPKALANIAGLEDVLADRTVMILLPRSLNPQILNSVIVAKNPVWQEIRDKLIALALTRWAELKAQIEAFQPPEGILGRDLEIWHPILIVARWISEEEYNRMLELARIKCEEKRVQEINDSRDLLLLVALVKNISEEFKEYSIAEIRKWVEAEAAGEDIRWLNAHWTGRALRRLGFKNSVKMSKRGGRHYYLISRTEVLRLADKIGLEVKELKDNGQADSPLFQGQWSNGSGANV